MFSIQLDIRFTFILFNMEGLSKHHDASLYMNFKAKFFFFCFIKPFIGNKYKDYN